MSANAVHCGWQGCPFPDDPKHPIHTEGWHRWTPVESDPEPVPEVPAAKGGASTSIRHVVMRLAMSDPDVDQDARDGEALRLLAQAVPNGFFVTYDRLIGGREPVWQVRLQFSSSVHDGYTIADAADACRKALEEQR